MRNYYFPLAAALALVIACSSQAAEKPRPAQGNQNQPKKVWTNDDLDQLRARGLISIVGQEATQPASQAPAAPAESTFPVYESRLDDPAWYADQAADLQAELTSASCALEQEQEAWHLPRMNRDHPARRGAGQAVRRRHARSGVACSKRRCRKSKTSSMN